MVLIIAQSSIGSNYYRENLPAATDQTCSQEGFYNFPTTELLQLKLFLVKTTGQQVEFLSFK